MYSPKGDRQRIYDHLSQLAQRYFGNNFIRIDPNLDVIRRLGGNQEAFFVDNNLLRFYQDAKLPWKIAETLKRPDINLIHILGNLRIPEDREVVRIALDTCMEEIHTSLRTNAHSFRRFYDTVVQAGFTEDASRFIDLLVGAHGSPVFVVQSNLTRDDAVRILRVAQPTEGYYPAAVTKVLSQYPQDPEVAQLAARLSPARASSVIRDVNRRAGQPPLSDAAVRSILGADPTPAMAAKIYTLKRGCTLAVIEKYLDTVTRARPRRRDTEVIRLGKVGALTIPVIDLIQRKGLMNPVVATSLLEFAVRYEWLIKPPRGSAAEPVVETLIDHCGANAQIGLDAFRRTFRRDVTGRWNRSAVRFGRRSQWTIVPGRLSEIENLLMSRAGAPRPIIAVVGEPPAEELMATAMEIPFGSRVIVASTAPSFAGQEGFGDVLSLEKFVGQMGVLVDRVGNIARVLMSDGSFGTTPSALPAESIFLVPPVGGPEWRDVMNRISNNEAIYVRPESREIMVDNWNGGRARCINHVGRVGGVRRPQPGQFPTSIMVSGNGWYDWTPECLIPVYWRAAGSIRENKKILGYAGWRSLRS